MEINELMIGDWVRIKDNVEPDAYFMHDDMHPGQSFKIEEILSYGINTDWCCGEVNSYLPEDAIEPIPLTPEILKKNGWVRTKYGYGRDCMEIHGADELPEGVDNALSMARWSIDKNYQYHFLELLMWEGSVMQHNVHYVHQLQHAFRIFGIEKEIEL